MPMLPWPTLEQAPLPDSEGEEGGDKDEEGGWEDEECADPVLPGQFETPAISKNTKPHQKTGEPSYTQPTCTSTHRKQLADIER